MSTFEQRSARALWAATWPVVDRRHAPVHEFTEAVAGLRGVVESLREEADARERTDAPLPSVRESLIDFERELEQCMRTDRIAGWAGRIALAYRTVCASLELSAQTRRSSTIEGDLR